GEKIFFLQLADAPALSMDVLSWSRHHRVFPGEGAWDLTDFLARVAATGYAGPVSLEVFNDSFRQADTQRTAIDGLRSLRRLEASGAAEASTGHGAAKASTGHGAATGDDTNGRSTGGPGTPDGTGLDLQPLPPVAAPSGINYVELSTYDLGTLTRQLQQL